jgi:branched-chain amino acid transport system ATP-binding protein
MPELAIEGVTVQFQGLRALDSVDLRLADRQILGLLGPNGAGKSTLVNVISGFQKPAAGHVRLDGEDVSNLSAERRARRGIARTFQSVRLFRRLTVFENIEVSVLACGKGDGQAGKVARAALDFVGLGGMADRVAGELPYAHERRVGIARALATGPRFLLLDEPAAGMTDVECQELVQIVRRLPEAYGCAVLLIEHNMNVVTELCSELHVLNGGRTLAVGPAEAVMRNPDVVAAYLGAA